MYPPPHMTLDTDTKCSESRTHARTRTRALSLPLPLSLCLAVCLSLVRPEAVFPDRALCLPTLSHFSSSSAAGVGSVAHNLRRGLGVTKMLGALIMWFAGRDQHMQVHHREC